MSNDTVNAYLRTQVMTASPQELRLMLLDAAVKFARQGKIGLAEKDYEASYTGITNCRNIVVELMTSIGKGVEPELAENLRGLYSYFFSELTDASLEKDESRLDNVIRLLEYERETWVMLMEKLAKENGATDAPSPRPAPQPQQPIDAGGPARSISFQA